MDWFDKGPIRFYTMLVAYTVIIATLLGFALFL